MATLLYRLGRFSFRQRRAVALLWLALLAAGVFGAINLSGSTTGGFRMPGTEAQTALDQLEEKFPQSGDGGATARVVFAAPPGTELTDEANQQLVVRTLGEFATAPQVGEVSDPFTTGTVSPDATIAFAEVSYQAGGNEITPEARTAADDIAQRARDAGLTVEISGLEEGGPGGFTEILGVAVAAIVLLVTFRAVVVAGLPLLTALIGIGIGMSGILTLTGFVDLSTATPTLSLMIGLAVAIDYALLIVSRYRQELAHGHEPQEAAGRAVGTAGSAVVFAGLTVIIALAGLAIVNVPFLTQMGLGAAGTVAVAVIIAVTLLPALLGFAGRRAAPSARTGAKAGPTMGLRWARFVTGRPIAVLVVATLGLGVLALPALGLRLGLPDDGMAAPDSTVRKAYDLVSEGFGPGFNGPLVIVVSGTSANKDATTADAGRVAATVEALPDVADVSPPQLNPAGDTAILRVVPGSGPNDEATTDLVTAIRAATGPGVAVTGLTAVNIDMSNQLSDSLIPYLLLVVGLAVVLLMLVFRSLLVPLKAALGFLLTVAATFGVVVAVFQWGWLAGLFGVNETGPIVSLMPIFLIGIVFGLAMDYQVFLVTRMREEYVHGAAPTEAVITGFGHGARVVTAAAIIMISVFSGFVLSEDPMIKMMGLGLAVAVLVDAFVVRMTIVPAVLTLLGRSAWWLPRWLDRLLPVVDVEGERLRAVSSAPDEKPELARV